MPDETAEPDHPATPDETATPHETATPDRPVVPHETAAPDERAGRRAGHPLPEERTAGSADPAAQAEALLAESDAREHLLAPDSFLERRTSEQAADPPTD
ncbi:MAG TPA: hypothetical protein VFB84_15805 [Micromonosporaceae bacterium]|nr:hypothetical protein [Micromonosporaceae bacterium]